jgi:hypothetical protein
MKVDVAVAELREKKTQEEDPPTVEAEIHNQYACPECDRWFDTQQGLAGHMRSHKKHESAQPMAETEEDAVDPTPAATDDTPTDASPGKDTAGPVADTSGDSHPAVVPHDSGLEIPKGYQVFVDRGGQYVVQYTDPATSEVTEIGRYPTADDAALAAQNHEYQLTQSVPSEVKLADIYAWMRLNRVPATAVADIINDTIYEDEFERFREEGAEKISSFNLDPDARRTLFEIVKQRHG